MRTRDPFGAAIGGLRTALEQVLAPGQHLPINDVAAALALSTSPVREALSRLCGEGLIEDRRGHGYFTRTAPLEDILGLLDLEAAHVRLAAAATDAPGPLQPEDAAVEAWIEGLMSQCDSVPLVESYGRVHDRLTPLRRLHGPVAVEPQGRDDDALAAYYARWRGAAVGLAARIRRQEPVPPQYIPKTV